jgi:hypothetical protein
MGAHNVAPELRCWLSKHHFANVDRDVVVGRSLKKTAPASNILHKLQKKRSRLQLSLSKISDSCLCLFLFNSMWQQAVGKRGELFALGFCK